MNLNATMVVQMVVFLVLAWFTKRFVWPPLITAIDERTKRIEAGLEAAEKGRQELEAVQKRVDEQLTEARNEAQLRIAEAEKRAAATAEEIRAHAHKEAERIIAQGKLDVEQQVIKARESLRAEVAAFAVKGAEQILRREVDPSTHAALLNQLKAEL